MNEPATTADPARTRPWLATWLLCWRELVRFFRQRNRVMGAVGQPVIFWLLFGAGLERSFRLSPTGESSGQSFQEYYFPGTLVLIFLFTAIFSTISIIEDRREGFLQSVLVAPIPRWSMVLGKVLGGSLIAMVQGMIFLLLALTLQIDMGWRDLAGLLALLMVAALGLTSFGFVLAWRLDSTQGFHAIMSVLLMPMWLLSGAFFPVPPLDSAASWLQRGMHWIMTVNPMTYCVAGARRLIFSDADVRALGLPSMLVCWIVTIVFALCMFLWAVRMARQRTTGDLL